MDYRIKEVINQGSESTFYIQKKHWWGWSTHTTYAYGFCFDVDYESLGEAKDQVNKWKNAVLKEIIYHVV